MLNSYKLHKSFAWGIYLITTFFSWWLLKRPDVQKDLITLLSTGAIVATFGSALSAIGSIWEKDLIERIRLNVDIFYKDIKKQDQQWRRWPFLERFDTQALLNGDVLKTTLENPKILLNVGSHLIKVDLPTILEDFFDLPLLKNFVPLIRYKNASITFLSSQERDVIDANTGFKKMEAIFAYQCLVDVWVCILKFRISRYLSHLGGGLTFSACLFSAIFSLMRN